MNRKALIMGGMVIGSSIGSLLPLLWGASALSMSSILLSAVGGIAGIWAGFKLSNW